MTKQKTPENSSENQGYDYKEHKRSLEERVEDFILKYKIQLAVGFGLAAVLILGYIGYNQLILGPMEQEAQEEIYRAQWAYEQESFEDALYGVQGEYPGFIDIAEDYSRTETGNLASYYAGTISLNLGEYQQAIEYLERFKTKSKMLGPLRLGGIGDAHAQLGDYKKAADYYMRAGKLEDNPLTAPIFFKKAGLAYEELGNYRNAINAYKKVRDDYSNTEEGRDIEKYINRAQSKAHTQGS